jgi:6-phosphofructokinase 2
MRNKGTLYTLTANPALDLSGHVEGLVPNEKNYVFRPRIDPGGNGINASRMAKRLGIKTRVLGFCGGPAGETLKALLKNEKLDFNLTNIAANTRTNVTVTNDCDHQQTRLTFPGPEIGRSEENALLNGIKKLTAPGILAIGGSLPTVSSKTFYTKTVIAAEQARLGIAVDVPAPYLKPLLKTPGPRLLLIKPNEVELEALTGKVIDSDDDVIKAAQPLLRRVAIVCVSLGSKGAIFLTHFGTWRGYPLKIKAKGSVGAGDSMVGGLLTELLSHGISRPEHVVDSHTVCRSLENAFRLGLAAGAATAQSVGTVLGSAKDARVLFSKAKVIRLC